MLRRIYSHGHYTHRTHLIITPTYPLPIIHTAKTVRTGIYKSPRTEIYPLLHKYHPFCDTFLQYTVHFLHCQCTVEDDASPRAALSGARVGIRMRTVLRACFIDQSRQYAGLDNNYGCRD